MNDTAEISRHIKRLRKNHRMKQKSIAKLLGISANYYSQIENGHRTLQLVHLLKLCDIFQVSFEEIVHYHFVTCEQNESTKMG